MKTHALNKANVPTPGDCVSVYCINTVISTRPLMWLVLNARAIASKGSSSPQTIGPEQQGSLPISERLQKELREARRAHHLAASHLDDFILGVAHSARALPSL